MLRKLEEVCLEALEVFGTDNAKDKVIEEMAELIVALKQLDQNRVTLQEVASEIADVEITLTKLKIALYDKDDYENALRTKILKLENQIILAR